MLLSQSLRNTDDGVYQLCDHKHLLIHFSLHFSVPQFSIDKIGIKYLEYLIALFLWEGFNA